MEVAGVEWTDMQMSDDDRFIALTSKHGVLLVDALKLVEVTLRSRCMHSW